MFFYAIIEYITQGITAIHWVAFDLRSKPTLTLRSDLNKSETLDIIPEHIKGTNVRDAITDYLVSVHSELDDWEISDQIFKFRKVLENDDYSMFVGNNKTKYRDVTASELFYALWSNFDNRTNFVLQPTAWATEPLSKRELQLYTLQMHMGNLCRFRYCAQWIQRVYRLLYPVIAPVPNETQGRLGVKFTQRAHPNKLSRTDCIVQLSQSRHLQRPPICIPARLYPRTPLGLLQRRNGKRYRMLKLKRPIKQRL